MGPASKTHACIVPIVSWETCRGEAWGGGLGVVWGWYGGGLGWSGGLSGSGLGVVWWWYGVAWGWSGVAGVGPVSIIGMPGVCPVWVRDLPGVSPVVSPGSVRGRSGGTLFVGSTPSG